MILNSINKEPKFRLVRHRRPLKVTARLKEEWREGDTAHAKAWRREQERMATRGIERRQLGHRKVGGKWHVRPEVSKSEM